VKLSRTAEKAAESPDRTNRSKMKLEQLVPHKILEGKKANEGKER